MKIRTMLVGAGAALAVAAGLAGLSGTASAEPKKPAVVPAAAPSAVPSAAPSAAPSPAPTESRPEVERTAGPKEPVAVKPRYTG
ncbi:hypothetical protein DMB42_12760 [Nonomuraea sp. WAC 01424]|uniref:hypothetical protein n=1 Tax=Nonomuraea sp. WAC 01424 TaxID=2203200 RepID=UPI000F76CD05|nr:hypothetical protein [Nonomuraea sp. WAC 01424]RSN11458.1 hypothetical protein DMB42_12760 [Nonomuraea sp. WAC 01424]